MRKIAIIPTLCTLGNAACGFASIIYAANLNPEVVRPEKAAYISGWLILVAMVFDALDGYLARISKTASNFGVQLDSLCDAISFGVAPGFLLVRLGFPFQSHRVIWDVFLIIASLYMFCAILRLARFNVQTTTDVKSHRSFLGLPSPAAGGCIASLAILRYGFTDLGFAQDAVINPVIHRVAPVAALVVALLMVSRVPYPHFVSRLLGTRRHSFARLVQLILAIFLIFLFPELTLVLGFWIYALSGPVALGINRLLHRRPSEEPTF